MYKSINQTASVSKKRKIEKNLLFSKKYGKIIEII